MSAAAWSAEASPVPSAAAAVELLESSAGRRVSTPAGNTEDIPKAAKDIITQNYCSGI